MYTVFPPDHAIVGIPHCNQRWPPEKQYILINDFIFLGTLMHFFLLQLSIYWPFLFIGPFPKKLAPKKGLQVPLRPSSKIFWLKHCV